MGPLNPEGHVAQDAGASRPVIDLLDRDGQVRQTIVVKHWPLRIGRALDNDVVLSDVHVAAHHLRIVESDAGLALQVADTINGVQFGTRHLRRGEQVTLQASRDAIALDIGRTHLRLRLPGHVLVPEVALAPSAPLARRLVASAVAALVLLGSVLFGTYLASDPEGLTRAIGSALLGALVGAAVWCGFWAMLSKVFTRQAHFGWHVRVFLFSGLALMVLGVVPELLAFAFSWPWATDFSFVGEIAVAAGALYFHLLAVEPARHRVLKWVAASCAVVGIALTLWFNVQRSDRFGDELYMTHLFPPALRLARPVTTDAFINGLAPLKKSLDKKAKEPARGDDTGAAEED